MLEKSLSSSSSLQMTFTEGKCLIRTMYVAITRRAVWRAKLLRRWYDNTNFSPPYLEVLLTPLLGRAFFRKCATKNKASSKRSQNHVVADQWSATTGLRPPAGPCEVCYRSVCVFRINALNLKHFYNVRRNFRTFLNNYLIA